MRINPTTLLFEELTDDEADQILLIAEDLVLRGKTPWPQPPWLVEWLSTAGNESQGLMMLGTAFPQRALLSFIRHYDAWYSKETK